MRVISGTSLRSVYASALLSVMLLLGCGLKRETGLSNNLVSSTEENSPVDVRVRYPGNSKGMRIDHNCAPIELSLPGSPTLPSVLKPASPLNSLFFYSNISDCRESTNSLNNIILFESRQTFFIRASYNVATEVDLIVVPQPVTQLRMVPSAGNSLFMGTCTDFFVSLTLAEAPDVKALLPYPLPLLAMDPSGGQFFGQGGCAGEPASQLVLPPAESALLISYRSQVRTEGVANLSLSVPSHFSPGLVQSASALLNVKFQPVGTWRARRIYRSRTTIVDVSLTLRADLTFESNLGKGRYEIVGRSLNSLTLQFIDDLISPRGPDRVRTLTVIGADTFDLDPTDHLCMDTFSMHQIMCGSVLNGDLFVTPFQRVQ